MEHMEYMAVGSMAGMVLALAVIIFTDLFLFLKGKLGEFIGYTVGGRTKR